jgi:hypothetical protein
MYEDCTGLKVDETYIVQINKKLNLKWLRTTKIEDIDYKFSVFNHVFESWRFLNPKASPKYLSYPTSIDIEFIKNNEIIRRET